MILLSVLVIIPIQRILTTIFYHYNKFREHNYYFIYQGQGDGGADRGAGGGRGGGGGR
jgi:hypothetical protein